MVMHILAAALLVLFTCSPVFAGPASPDPIDILQPDGSSIRARIQGDEFQGWTESEDTGHTILQNKASGFWEYAEQAKDGTLRPNGMRVLPRGLNAPSALPKGLRPPRNKDNERRMKYMLQDIYQQRLQSSQSDSSLSSTSESSEETENAPGDWTPVAVSGPKKALIILISFADRAMLTSPSGWYTSVFDESAKSVAKFYKENSFGKISVSPASHTQPGNPAGVISVTVADNHPNYGKNYNYATETLILNHALSQAAPYINFASYDTNGNGTLEQSELTIYFIYAGYEASGSSLQPNVWAHAWGGSIIAGSKTVTKWAQNGELNNASVQHPMGVIAHELGHALCGLPDLYDISGQNQGLGNFSIMAGGSWGRDSSEPYGGTTPTTLDAWAREFLGWSAPVVPVSAGPLSLGYSLTSSSAVYKLVVPSTSSTEYFLVENRQPTSWDLGLRGTFGGGWLGGLLIMHIDNTSGSLGSNDINSYSANLTTPGHQGVVPVQASTASCNMLSVGSSCRGNVTTLFYSGNSSTWTPSSIPNSNYYSGAATGFYMTAVSAASSIMTAEFSYGPPTIPGAPNMGLATRGNGQASVSFSAPVSDGGSAITSYTVTSSPGGKTATGASSPLMVTGLTNGTAYTFTATATNANGTGPVSGASNSVTPATIPGAPANVTAARGNGQAFVSFSAPAFDGGIGITNYTVTSSPGGYIGMGGSSPVTVGGLTNGTAYTFTVTATNSVGTSPPSTASNSVTPATVPGAPSISAVTVGSGRATVGFFAPVSDGGSIVTGYKVTANSGQFASSTMSPITVTGLTDGVAYTFTVAATNSVGEGSASPASGSAIPGVVHNSGFDSKGYVTLQDAYNADTHTAEIQIVAGASVGSFVKYESDTVAIKGGFDAAFSASIGSPAILDSVVLKDGTTRFYNVIVRSP